MAKVRAEHTEARLDWFTATGRVEDLPAVLAWGTEWWGEPMVAKGGRKFFRHGFQWASGASVWYNVPEEGTGPACHRGRFMLELSGSVLGVWSRDEAMDALQDVFRRGASRVTRLDVAVDCWGTGVDLVGATVAACERRELRGAKRWEPMRSYSGSVVVGDGVYLGKRGCGGSGRFVRCYDKGLETGERAWGQWQRWEVQFGADHARLAFAWLGDARARELGRVVAGTADVGCGDAPGSFDDGLRRIAVGAVDFTCDTGRKERSADKRPRALWWAEVVQAVTQGGGPKRVRVARRRVKELQRTWKWMRRCVVKPLMAMAEATNRKLAEVFDELTKDVQPEMVDFYRADVWQYVQVQRRRNRRFLE